MSNKISCRFVKKHRFYNAGEIAGFAPPEAQKLIDGGFAVPNDPTAQGIPATPGAGTTVDSEKAAADQAATKTKKRGRGRPRKEKPKLPDPETSVDDSESEAPTSEQINEAREAVMELQSSTLVLPEETIAILTANQLDTVSEIVKFNKEAGLASLDGIDEKAAEEVVEAINQAINQLVS